MTAKKTPARKPAAPVRNTGVDVAKDEADAEARRDRPPPRDDDVVLPPGEGTDPIPGVNC